MSDTNNESKEDKPMQVKPYERLVSLAVHQENVFHFPEGLPAFENVKEFIFLCQPDTQPFFFMQSLAPPDLAFVCIDPFLIFPGYEPKIPEADVKLLRLDRPEDALFISLVTVNKDMKKTTANLHGPLVINLPTCVGKQIVCEGQPYDVRFRIWDVLDKIEGEKTSHQQQKNTEKILLSAQART